MYSLTHEEIAELLAMLDELRSMIASAADVIAQEHAAGGPDEVNGLLDASQELLDRYNRAI